MRRLRSGRPWPWWLWLGLGGLAGGALVVLGVQLLVRPEPAPPPPVATPASAWQPTPRPLGPREGLPSWPRDPSPTEVPPSTELAPHGPGAPEPQRVEEVPAAAPPAPVAAYAQGAGRLALVIDDMGLVPDLSAQAMALLPPEVALAFLPYGEASTAHARQAKAEGHAVLVHLPMEPLPQPQGTPDMGPHGLAVAAPSATLVAHLAANLHELAALAEGANNHMGSRFTQWAPGMRLVLQELQARGLYFLDSRTAAPTVTAAVAAEVGLPYATRDVFLDHEPTPAAVRGQLARAVRLAQARAAKGDDRPVVVIGHPLPVTLAVLAAELPLVQAAGVTLVPLRESLHTP